MKYNFLKVLSLFLSLGAVVACDKDYMTIGGDIIGGENFDVNSGVPFEFKLYNQTTGPVQTNGLPVNLLGYLRDDDFGKTTATVVTQLNLGTIEPKFGGNVVIDSVVLSLPYIANRVTKDGKSIYELQDSYGTEAINLKVFRNNYEILDHNPEDEFLTNNRYFSNDSLKFKNVKSGLATNTVGIGDNRLNNRLKNRLNTSTEDENIKFIPSISEIKILKTKAETEKVGDNNYVVKHTLSSEVESVLAPTMRLHLDKGYFNDVILKAEADKLKTQEAFKKYFKGLYFEVAGIAGSKGKIIPLDFKKGNVTIYYKEDSIVADANDVDKDGNTTETIINARPLKTLTLNMSGNTINFYNYEDSRGILSQVNPLQQNPSKIVLKGGQGAMVFIDLFSNEAEFNALKTQDVFVNEASLTFTVDNNFLNIKNHPLRLYLYDVDNETVLIDYAFDRTTVPSDSKKDKYIFDGIVKEVKEGDVVKKRQYKIRITNHVNQILKGSRKNARLGLVITDNINVTTNGYLKNEISYTSPINENKKTNKIPTSSIHTPLWTVLNGVGGEDGVKFNINYTVRK